MRQRATDERGQSAAEYLGTKDLGLFEERKSEIDRRFYEDMKDHCATRSAFLQASCYGWARRFYAGVVAFG